MAEPKGNTPQLVREQFAVAARNYAVSKVHAQGEDLPSNSAIGPTVRSKKRYWMQDVGRGR